MRNSEVYAYIERLYDAVMSVSDAVRLGVPEDEAVDEVICVIKDLEEEVRMQMQAEEEQKSGFESTPFFSELAESTYDELINIGERMDSIHPSLGKFMYYLMAEDDPTFFICYGEDDPNLIGRSSDMWAFKSATLIRNRLLRGGSLNDK